MIDKLKEDVLLRWLENQRVFIIRMLNEYTTEGHEAWSVSDEQVYQQIVATLNRPVVTEELIEEKAKELWILVDTAYENYIKIIKDFIRKLVEEILR